MTESALGYVLIGLAVLCLGAAIVLIIIGEKKL